MKLTKDAILAADDSALESVAVPEWGGEVSVRVMSGAQRDRFEGAVAARRDKDGNMNAAGLRALLCSLTICDDSGALLFGESDIPALESKSAAALQRVFDVAARLNGLGSTAVEEARSDFSAGRS
jgi:hypothetical protein